MLGSVWILLFGTTASFGAIHYVDVNNPTPSSPYLTWATAAVTIQDAVDTAIIGDQIIVTNGVYETGGRIVHGSMSNRVAITKAITVQSVNGPAVTTIKGYSIPVGGYGDSAVRCVYLTNNAFLSGFTLTNGATRALGDFFNERSGGGIRCAASSAIVSNCIIVGNSAYQYGGGAYNGTLKNCLLMNNVGGVGGGASSCNMNNCLVVSNYASSTGGVDGGTATINNCTIVRNTGIGSIGGVGGVNFNNCIIYGNYSTNSPNFSTNSSMLFNYCCTTPLPTKGFASFYFGGNFTNAPQFVDADLGNFQLQPTSPCINSGNNSLTPAGPDMAGSTRVIGGTVDAGAYEYATPTSLISYAWLQNNSFPIDGSADFSDADGDGMNNWQEWRSDTSPTDSFSVLKLLSISTNASGISVVWQSTTNRTYQLDRATNLAAVPAFSMLKSNIAGLAGATTFIDSNAPGVGPYFYRVSVR